MISDGRCLAISDLNRDGLNDCLLTNANKPTLGIFENRIANLKQTNNFIAISIEGGNTNALESDGYSNRDGIGAMIRVTSADTKQMREVRCGEGLATQSSRVHIFGLGNQSTADLIEIRWPSGRQSKIENVLAGKLVKVYENTSENDMEFETVEYIAPGAALPKRDFAKTKFEKLPFELPIEDNEQELFVVTAMATWCDACKKEIPNLQLINSSFSKKIGLIGIPIDEADDSGKLSSYQSTYNPPYQLLPNEPQRATEFTQWVVDQLGSAATPFSIVVSPDREILMTVSGIPTISDLRKLRAESSNSKSP